MDYAAIERELKTFETEERRRLGLDERAPRHWHDANPQTFTHADRETTTILLGGLTLAHDTLLTGALAGLGYRLQALDCPDVDSLRFGKEFGNRGQCNPTYFTVGNLVKTLTHLRDVEGMSVPDIIRRYVFFTAGACGPCRFGTYVTEYRKALADSGFEGFRVLLFQQQGGLRQATGDASGLEMNAAFFRAALQATMAGDCLNLAGYRIRPYEVTPATTDARARRSAASCCTTRSDAAAACPWRSGAAARGWISIAVDRLRPKPKVSIIGEFWAMTTEGDGNYRLQRFLEAEGAEVDIQPVVTWVLYNIWEHQHDTRQAVAAARRRPRHGGPRGQGRPHEARAALGGREGRARASSGCTRARSASSGYHLPDMDQVATISHQYYDNHLRGGEGHMEVGKLDADRDAPQGAHGDQRQAVRLHAVVRRLRRRAVADHRPLPGGDLHARSRRRATAR